MNHDDAVGLITSMGWRALPYGCAGLARAKTLDDGRSVWSWLIMIPWAAADSKPWIDGVEVLNKPLTSEEGQADIVFQRMRDILDERYGESFGKQTVEEFLRELGDG